MHRKFLQPYQLITIVLTSERPKYDDFFLYLVENCKCTSHYNLSVTINASNTRVEAHCNKWGSSFAFCYLHGGLEASKCPGAFKSSRGDFYLTKDPNVCIEPEVIGSGEIVSLIHASNHSFKIILQL